MLNTMTVKKCRWVAESSEENMGSKTFLPEIVVFAGPNGSGKSTITELLKPNYDYVNADEIKKHLKCSDIEAAKIAEEQRENLLSGNKDFCFETVLSTDRNLKLLKRAKEKDISFNAFTF